MDNSTYANPYAQPLRAAHVALEAAIEAALEAGYIGIGVRRVVAAEQAAFDDLMDLFLAWK